MKKFYLTTTLPYVNAVPHLGHALEFVQADMIARGREFFFGDEVFFNTGTDEHGMKIYQRAVEEGRDPKDYADEYAEKFREFSEKLNMKYSAFIRTTDKHHENAAREFWKRCEKNGDIYKAVHRGKYCVGCETEKVDSDLQGGRCPEHPNLEIESFDEENYFFKFSKYEKPLLELYQKHPNFVVPNFRFNEIKSFVSGGLRDFSVSRLREKMPWGIPVPGDENHVMYVWFDALVNYISTLGWPEDEKNFEDFWGTKENPNAFQVAGTDNLRPQSAMWQAMLMSAGLPNSKQIFIHGYITGGGGIKMSKTLGNVVDPIEIINEYGTDALRYFLLREIPPYNDGDFTKERFVETYNASLVNGIGNLASRVMKMAFSNGVSANENEFEKNFEEFSKGDAYEKFKIYLGSYEFKKACDVIWGLSASMDKEINEKKPFSLVKESPNEGNKIIKELVFNLFNIGKLLYPILPTTSGQIVSHARENRPFDIPLFPRK